MFAYIPARGGSKRIPRKNIRTIGDKPALTWVIEALKGLPFLSGIHVSTDDPEIKEIAEAAGATCLDLRAPELSNATSGFIDLIHHDTERYSAHHGGDREMLFVLATAVLVPTETYVDAFALYQAERPDVLMSCEPFNSPPFWALVQRPDKSWTPLFPDEVLVNSQDLPPTLADAGLFYMLNLDTMKRFQSVKMVDRLRPYLVDHQYCVDVDTPRDWAILEEKFQRLRAEVDAAGDAR